VYAVEPNNGSKKIDVYFTSGTTILEGTCTSSSGSGSGSNTGVTDTDIEAFNDLVCWIDLAPSRTLAANFSECSLVGDLPKHLYNRSPGNLNLIFTGNWDFEVYAMNSNVNGVSRDSDPAGGHGMHLIDSSYPTAQWAQEFQCHSIVKMSASYNDTTGFFKFGNDQCRVQTGQNGVVKYVSSGGTIVLSNIIWVPGRTYILSIRRVFNNTTSAYEFHFRWEDLDTQTVSTEVSDAGAAVVPNSQVNWSIGVSGIYMRHIFGPIICCNGLDTTEYDNAISWIKKWHSGTSTSGSSEESSSSCEDATFFAELDIAVK
jgi:hypothetical protein